MPTVHSKILCSVCDQEYDEEEITLVQKENAITGAKNQFRCKLCNAAKSRITRMMAARPEDFSGYDNIATEDRKQLMREAHELFNQDLAKMITETILKSSMKRLSEKSSEHGDFKNMKDAAAIFADKPDEWANLQKNAPRIKCKYTLAELIFVPNYSFCATHEYQREETRKRKIEAESKAKKIKAKPTAVEVPASTASNGQGPGDKQPKDLVAKELTDKQIDRMNKIGAKLEKQKVATATVVVAAEAEDMAGHFPLKVLERVKVLQTALEEIDTEREAYIQSGKMNAVEKKEFFEKCKTVDTPLSALIDNLQSCLKMKLAQDKEDA